MNFIKKLSKYQKPLFVALDSVALLVSMFAAAFVSEGLTLSGETAMKLLRYCPINILLTVTVFFTFKLYKGILSLASATEAVTSTVGCFISTLAMLLLSIFIDAVAQKISLPSRTLHITFFISFSASAVPLFFASDTGFSKGLFIRGAAPQGLWLSEQALPQAEF